MRRWHLGLYTICCSHINTKVQFSNVYCTLASALIFLLLYYCCALLSLLFISCNYSFISSTLSLWLWLLFICIVEMHYYIHIIFMLLLCSFVYSVQMTFSKKRLPKCLQSSWENWWSYVKIDCYSHKNIFIREQFKKEEIWIVKQIQHNDHYFSG